MLIQEYIPCDHHFYQWVASPVFTTLCVHFESHVHNAMTFHAQIEHTSLNYLRHCHWCNLLHVVFAKKRLAIFISADHDCTCWGNFHNSCWHTWKDPMGKKISDLVYRSWVHNRILRSSNYDLTTPICTADWTLAKIHLHTLSAKPWNLVTLLEILVTLFGHFLSSVCVSKNKRHKIVITAWGNAGLQQNIIFYFFLKHLSSLEY